MQLIRLSANHNSFNTVNFNPSGLTLIVGAHSKKGSTYNGVGKSLIVELLHFCLGSSKNEEFERKIPQWEFTLEFALQGEKHKVSRNTTNQKVVYLDDAEMKVSDLNAWLESRLFSIPADVKGLSFRALIPKFLRRGLKQYVDPRQTGEQSDYEVLLRNAFLLGIDVHLIAEKATIRNEITRLKQLRANFKNDPLLREFYAGGRDTDIHLQHLEGKIASLEAKKAQFVVAENYYDLQLTADELAADIESDKNELFLKRSAVENITASMHEHPDVSLERVGKVYGELFEAFKETALKRLDEVAQFHQRLLQNRLARLSREKLRLVDEIAKGEDGLRKKQADLDRSLRVLGTAQALDQYTALVNEIGDLALQAQKLRDYKAIDLEYSNRSADLDVKLGEEVKKTNLYLEETKQERDEKFGTFTNYVSKFYPGSPAGITLHNNEGNNQKRFDFDVRVENDSSDGINEVRILCYDLTLISLRQNHKLGFLFHDGRLFANMDVRQRARAFQLVDEESRSRGFQYIATLNPDFVSGMQQEFSWDEFSRIISQNVVLELKDDSPAGKLLGIQVDMHYEK
ncbi:DUF2326 domain-containing protein [Variovorax atrisoli]|uniref:DUF2326 domain-containing protein n=1 Tax=Variovorax atrisoli TaxID=3394203 RepID=UPI00119C80CC|nr:DUF2326 domain-containing protein [Variovorax paradoxus]MDR6524586.1 uncharacterized protein YydD (DUF2326 family) [Variovorax paradoxus]